MHKPNNNNYDNFWKAFIVNWQQKLQVNRTESPDVKSTIGIDMPTRTMLQAIYELIENNPLKEYSLEMHSGGESIWY